jgi:DNA-binding transcriptional regulator YdaS (Cro superfamily)
LTPRAGAQILRIMRNEMTLDALVTELTRNCGDELAACKTVGVSLLFVNQWRKDDAKVDAALTEAANVGTQGLVSAAIQRAVHGIQMDVYYKGEVVGQQTEYSDGLLTTLLKAKRPEFAAEGAAGVNVQVNVANIMPRANSYSEWLAMKDQTINRAKTSVLSALPAPDASEVIDVEYVAVEPALPNLL